ncbi:MAG: CapA family protein [Candidatus Cloacimonetes bacterium]|nr:CapA family protein [Candidatus Cloacimonadota bacterium]
MKRFFVCFIIPLLLICSILDSLQDKINLSCSSRSVQTIEDFESGDIQLQSYPGEDEEPESWFLSEEITYLNSNYSLCLYGNTWKMLAIEATAVDSGDIWEVAFYMVETGEIEGIGFLDGENALFYSLAGTQELNIEEWITVYQGAFESEQWHGIGLPLADDWYAWFDYLPTVTHLIFVNDCDQGPEGIVYFDNIIDFSDNIPASPLFEIDYTILEDFINPQGDRSVQVRFYPQLFHPPSMEHYYLWDFGDGECSTRRNPLHTYLNPDDHSYTVLLQITNQKGYYGLNSRQFDVEQGPSNFPVTLNFVGDIMLARGYEEPGGIIPTQGVESIFDPTLPILGEAADITIANLECPLTNHNEHHPTKTIFFKGDPANVSGLVHGGIDIVTLANNHTLDYNYPGLAETQSVLAASGIKNSGAGINSYEAYTPIFYSAAGLNFAFLASSDRTGQYNNYQPYLNAGYSKPGFAYMTPYYLQQQISEVRDIADLVIIEMHAGSEYSSEPGSNYDYIDPDDAYPEEEYSPDIDIPHMWDLEIRHHAIDAGADLVIVHHPHIIQGLELYNGKLIAHSLGNFIFDLVYTETMPSMILQTEVDGTGFYEFTVIPVFIDDWIPQPASGALGIHILDYLARRSRDLGTYLAVDRENIQATVIMDTLTMPVYDEQYTSSTVFNLENGYAVSAPIELVRNGNIAVINSITPGSNCEYRLGREIVWFGNFENEGCTLWDINSSHEWYDDEEFYEGERSLCQRRYSYSGDNIITNLEQRLRRYGSEYSLQGYIKTQNGSGVTIEVRYYETRYSSWYISDDDVGTSINGDTDWDFYYLNLEVPENCSFFDIRCSSDCPDDGVAYAWFDNIGLIEWTDWAEYFPGVTTTTPNDFYYLQIRSSTGFPTATVDYTERNYGIPPARNNDPVPADIPAAKLQQNFPNPFNPDTQITYELHAASRINLSVYNIKGQLIRKLVEEKQQPGYYVFDWNGRNNLGRAVPTGVYLYRLDAGSCSITRKCILIK